MPNKQWDKFYEGNGQDDIIIQPGQIVEGKNVTGLRTGYGITLGPKVIKGFTTNGDSMFDFGGFLESTNETAIGSVGNDATDGFIYKADATDDTPSKTIDSGDTVYTNLDGIFEFKSNIYFIGRNPSGIAIGIHKISLGDFVSGTWSGIAYDEYTAGQNHYTLPILDTGDILYIGVQNGIVTFDGTTYTLKSIVRGDVVGLSVQGTMIKIYTDKKLVYYWDGVSAAVNSKQRVKFIPHKVNQHGPIDFITAKNGDLYLSGGYDYTRVSKARKSRRLNDNSQYLDILNFSNIDVVEVRGGDNYYPSNNQIEPGDDDIYIIGDDGIYQSGDIIPGLQPTLHKILDIDNTGTDIDEIYSLRYIENLNRLYFSYKQGSITGVDYIDLSTLTTSQDGYIITEIFRGPPDKVNKITQVRATTSFTNGSNYIKIYKRINNGSWVLIRTVNDSTATIERHKISTNNGTGNLSDEFIDIQFKAELHNDTQVNIPPILHSLELIYSINKE